MRMNLKNVLILFFIGLLSLVLVACGGEAATNEKSAEENTNGSESNSGDEIEELKFRIAHNMPVEHHTAKGIQKFADLISEKSDGKIEVSIFPSGQLYDDTTMADAVTSGQVEVGMSSIHMWTGHIPSAALFSTPLFRNYEDLHEGLESGISDLLTEEFNKMGAHPLIWADYGFAYTASTKRALITPDDYKGMRVRVLSPLDAFLVEEAGGSPVSMGGGEVDQALQKGTIDAALSGTTSFFSRQYYQYTGYFNGPIAGSTFPVTANLDWWNNLPENTKKLITEAANDASKWISEESEKSELEAMKALKSEGMEYAEVDEDAFKEVFDAVVNQYIQNGGETAEKIVEIARKVTGK